MRARLKTLLSAKQVEKTLPWLVLSLTFPALVLFNTTFIKLFPSSSAPTNESSGIWQSMAPDQQLFQSAFVYNSRNPNKLFGNFYYTLGTQLAAQGQLIPAESMLSKAIKLMPENPYPHLNYGIVLEALQRYPEAMTQYQEVVRLEPKSVQALYNLGLLYDKMGNTPAGIQTLQAAVNIAPENPLVNYDLGVLYAKQNNYAQSAIYSGKAAQLVGNGFAEAYNNYGYALAQLGRYEEALVAINKSLELKPDSAAALDSKGFAYFGMGRYDEALKAFQDAIKQDPTIGEIYLHLGQAYEKLKAFDKSVKAYETYLQLTPDASDRVAVEEKVKQLKQWMPATPSKP